MQLMFSAVVLAELNLICIDFRSRPVNYQINIKTLKQGFTLMQILYIYYVFIQKLYRKENCLNIQIILFEPSYQKYE